MRIVSLLPAATELVAALELGHALVGRTHECDHPPGMERVPVMTRDLLPPAQDPAAIDRAVREGLSASSTIYALDEGALVAARPDVILTQRTCAVCAVDGAEVERAVASLDHPVDLLLYDPHRLSDLPIEVERIGRALGDTRAGLALRSHLERRMAYVAAAVDGLPRTRVAVIEWPDPLFAPGHWVPDVVEAAGAVSVFGIPGERSVTSEWNDLVAARPDAVFLSFCGFDLPTTLDHAERLLAEGHLAATGAARIFAIDGSAWLSRPGPRLVDALEALASMLHDVHPDLRPAPGMAAELVGGEWRDVAAIRI